MMRAIASRGAFWREAIALSSSGPSPLDRALQTAGGAADSPNVWPVTSMLPAEHVIGPPPAPDAGRPGGSVTPEQVVTLLARAVQRHHAYPAASPLCAESVLACHRAFTALRTQEAITLRVLPGRLLLDEAELQSAALAGTELSRRFRRAGISSLTIDREVSARELARFCREIVRRDHAIAATSNLAEVLIEQGVEKIQVSIVHRPEVLELGVPSPARLSLLEHERARQARAEALGAPTHLYPPGKGWVRVDPVSPLTEASLLDLVVLIEDPAVLAAMLVQLSEEAPPKDAAEALTEKVEEIASLIGAMDPLLAERLFAQLARSILTLDAERRQHLLREAVLPGLFEGRADGSVLRHFPDVELADALSLLLDLHVAAPEMLSAALDRLNLPQERRDRVRPLLDQRLAEHQSGEEASRLRPGEIDGYADGSIKIDHAGGKSFRDFVAHDLAIDAATRELLTAIADGVVATDPLLARVRCVHDILLVETNPDTALELSELAERLLAQVRDRKDLDSLAYWAAAFRAVAERAVEERPDVAEDLLRRIAALPSASLILDLANHAEGEAQTAALVRMIQAFGEGLGPAVAEAVAAADERRRRALGRLLGAHAARLAPVLAAQLDGAPPAVARCLLQAIASAPAGQEPFIAPLTAHADEHVAREAFRTLARAASPAALRAILGAIHAGGRAVALAEEAFWRLPPTMARLEARRLLADRTFVGRHPEIALMMLGRLADQSPGDAAAVAPGLAALRFHVWRPARMRLGMAAAALKSRAA